MKAGHSNQSILRWLLLRLAALEIEVQDRGQRPQFSMAIDVRNFFSFSGWAEATESSTISRSRHRVMFAVRRATPLCGLSITFRGARAIRSETGTGTCAGDRTGWWRSAGPAASDQPSNRSNA